MITDAHNHVIPEAVLDLFREFPEYRVEVRGGRWHGGNHVDFDLVPDFVDVNAKLAALERSGIERAVLSVAPPLFYYELEADAAARLAAAANRGMAQIHAAAPERLWWLAHVPMQFPDLSVRVLEDAALATGCVGVQVGSSIAGRRLDEPDFMPFWSAVERLSLPVMVHPDPSYTDLEALVPFYLKNVIGMPLETTITIKRLIAAGVLARHPRVKIFLVHGGGYFPYQGGRLKHAATVRPELRDAPGDPWSFLDQIWFDVITHDVPALAYLVSRVGADRVLLGTDMPFDMALPDSVARVREAVPDGIADLITAGNSEDLFSFDKRQDATSDGNDQSIERPALLGDHLGPAVVRASEGERDG